MKHKIFAGLLALTLSAPILAQTRTETLNVKCMGTKELFQYLKNTNHSPVFVAKQVDKHFITMWMNQENKGMFVISPMNSNQSCVLATMHSIEVTK